MVQKIVQIGNSQGVILPLQIRKQLGLRKGAKVVVELNADKQSIVISKAGRVQGVTSVSPDFFKALERVNKRYGSALAELAGR